MFGKLSLQQSPPLSVPVRFFLTAPLFGILAASILLVKGPDMLLSRWTPGLLAATHCLTLGFFASVMIGATQQLLPVLVGSVITRPRLIATLIHSQWLPGILLLIAAFFSYRAVLLVPALILIASALLTFAGIILYSLHKGVSANESAPGVRLAVIALVITLVLGVILGLGYTAIIPLWRPALTNLHLAWGLLGWMGLLIMVIAWQVVPMFQITRAYPALLRRITIPAVVILLLLKSLLLWPATGKATAFAGSLVNLCLALLLFGFAAATLYLQSVSRRKIRDSHRDFWRLAMLDLLLTLCCWAIAARSGSPVFYLLTGVCFLLGFAMAVVTGMLLKIISFLVWLHLQALNEDLQAGGRAGFVVPKMKRVIADRKSDVLLFCLSLAQLCIITAVLYPRIMAVPAAVAWLVFFVLLGVILSKAVLRYYQIVNEYKGQREHE